MAPKLRRAEGKPQLRPSFLSWCGRADENSRMDVEDLGRKVRQSLDLGQEPFCVVATAGTTITGNIDPLPDVAQVARQHDLCLHMDAIHGGACVSEGGIAVPLTLEQHVRKLHDPPLCEQLPVRDYLDDVVVRTNGAFLAGYELRGLASYFASDEGRDRGKVMLEALLRSLPEQSMTPRAASLRSIYHRAQITDHGIAGG
jgi:hypothetical protein